MPDRIRRMGRLEAIADEVLSYREVSMITAQLIDCMRIGMLQNLDDPGIIWDVLSEVTDAARAQLEPLGYGIGWRMP
jgi:hypothetical protein